MPAFKLKQNDGKTELIRDVAAPGAKSKRFFEGWNMFIKAARSFEADFNFIDNLDARPVAIFLNMPSLEIKKVEIGDTVDLMGVKAVASVHKSAETIFSGVQKMETAMFIAKAIEKNGAANPGLVSTAEARARAVYGRAHYGHRSVMYFRARAQRGGRTYKSASFSHCAPAEL